MDKVINVIGQSKEIIKMKKDEQIVSAQIVGIKREEIICKTENNKLINIDLMTNDDLFMKVMVDLLISGLWVPVNKKLKRFMEYDWLDNRSIWANY